MDNKTLETMGEPNRIELVPGLVLEDKMRIRTQRKLEKHFGLPIERIFPGERDGVKWPGIDWNFLNNSIPLITIMAQQVDPNMTESMVEELMEDENRQEEMLESLVKVFEQMGDKKDIENPTMSKKKLRHPIQKK